MRCNRHGVATSDCDDERCFITPSQSWIPETVLHRKCGCVTTLTRHALTATCVTLCDTHLAQSLKRSSVLRDARMVIAREQARASVQRRIMWERTNVGKRRPSVFDWTPNTDERPPPCVTDRLCGCGKCKRCERASVLPTFSLFNTRFTREEIQRLKHVA